jgi:hypothetical protein
MAWCEHENTVEKIYDEGYIVECLDCGDYLVNE